MIETKYDFTLFDSAKHRLDVNIFDKKHGALRISVPEKSIHTLIYK